MKTKEKQSKKIKFKITIKNIITILAIIVIILFSIQFYYCYFDNSKTYGKENISNDIKISNAQDINLDEILEKNVNNNIREEIEKQEEQLEYITKYKTNTNLPKGMIQVIQEGREGKQERVIKKKYENNELVSEEQISTKITKASVDKIVEIGGANYSSKYTVKVGDTVYVTADRIAVMSQPSEDSEKLTTFSSGNELKILEINNNWYKILSGNTKGWVKSESTTYINPNANNEKEENNSSSQENTTKTAEKSKNELTSKLDFNMALNEPSGLSLEQFKKVLTDSKDTNNIFAENAQYFYYIEEQYKINGIFIASIGIHESAWGTSNIAKNKNNLFGYGAYDSNPYNGAYIFTTYSESIDLMARVMVKYYINPKGTSIYGGETAQGTYYNGPTVTGVNTRYATDKNWANCVYNYIKYLYNKL